MKISKEILPKVDYKGGLKYEIPFGFPKYYNIAPEMTLQYSSLSMGRRSFGVPVGAGWKLSKTTYIRRANSNRGLPNYQSSDIYLLDDTSEIIPCVNGLESASCNTGGSHTFLDENYHQTSYDPIDNKWTITTLG